MTEDIMYISCDRCGAKTSQDEIYLDDHENTICITCHNHRVWQAGFRNGFAFGTIIFVILTIIVVAIMRI